MVHLERALAAEAEAAAADAKIEAETAKTKKLQRIGEGAE